MSATVPVGYKQTQVGVIPEDWSVSTVGDEFEIKLGKMIDAEKNVGTLKPYVGNKAVQWGRIDIDDLPMVAMSRGDIERFRLRFGDLLVCEGGEVGRAAIWEAPLEECYYQKALHRLRPLRGFDSQIMAALLMRWSERGQLINYVTQTSIAHLPRDKFLSVPMAVPPVEEQRAIAAVLSDVDTLLAKLDALLAKKRGLKQATMQQLLTGQTRLPGFSGRWAKRSIASFSAFVTKGATPTTYGFKWVNDGVIFLRSECIGIDKLDLAQSMYISEAAHKVLIRGEVRPGDILMTITGNVGRVVTVDEKIGVANINQHIARIRVVDTDVSPDFVAHWLSQSAVRHHYSTITTGQAYPQLSLKQVRETLVPLGSIDEQLAIATVLSSMDAELQALEARRDKTRALKQGMMQELLTGRIRLV